jgi:hypothetical protein
MVSHYVDMNREPPVDFCSCVQRVSRDSLKTVNLHHVSQKTEFSAMRDLLCDPGSGPVRMVPKFDSASLDALQYFLSIHPPARFHF